MLQNVPQKEKLISGNACCHAFQNLLSSHPVTENVKIKKKINFTCFVWVWNLISHIRGGKTRSGAYENRVLRRIFGTERDEMSGGWRKLHSELHNLNSPTENIRLVFE
jgi:hypothetical protein